MLSAERKEQQIADLRNILTGDEKEQTFRKDVGEEEEKIQEEEQEEKEEVIMLIEEWLIKVR